LLDGGERRALNDDARVKILSVNEEMAKDALRVLGVGYKELPKMDGYGEDFVEKDLAFLGLVGMMDPPREEAIEAVKVCQQVHIKPVMITGDHKLTAVAIAKELGIYHEGDLVLTGEELSKLGDEEFERMVKRVTVYARVSPMDKLKIIRAWKEQGEVVAMTGDGVNDAPALKHADIGIAMGITGTEVAKEASDIVLGDDNFATIVRAIERGRWIYDNIKKYLVYLLRANITEVVVLGGVVMITDPEFLPLLPAAILYINLATDGPPALALGVAPPDPDIMQRPPRDPKESVFSWDVRTLILMGVVVECPIFLWVFFQNFANLELARTKIFFMYVIIELILALNFRSLKYSIFQAPPHKWLLLSIVGTLAFTAALIQVPGVLEAFGIAAPAASDLGIIVALGLFVTITIEITKAVLRAKAPVARAISP
jgi:Ca2+-transporting ATPase